MLEFGFAWLYMNRNGTNSTSSQVRSQFRINLNTLRNKVDSFDNELLFSGSLTDKKKIIENIKEFSQIVDNVIAKAKTIGVVNSTSPNNNQQ